MGEVGRKKTEGRRGSNILLKADLEPDSPGLTVDACSPQRTYLPKHKYRKSICCGEEAGSLVLFLLVSLQVSVKLKRE